MRIAGEATLDARLPDVWGALLDPSVLVRTIPGCERLETTGENAYAMTVTVGVAAVRGTYAGTCRLTDLDVHRSLLLTAEGAGAPGTIAAEVDVRFSENPDGTTTLTYDADTVVGGMLGGVGQRMLGSVSRRLAAEFFAAVEQTLTGAPAFVGATVPTPTAVGAAATAEGQPPEVGAVFTAPPRPGAAAAERRDFLAGVAVGAGLVALGVALGAVLGRRR
jgi:carbon monoxide dehydrogenase subunit G